MYINKDKEMLQCPFNPVHCVSRLRLQAHIQKCKKQYPDGLMVHCYYNYSHIIKPEEMYTHLEACPDRVRLEGSRYNDYDGNLSMSNLTIRSDKSDSGYRDTESVCASVNSAVTTSTFNRGSVGVRGRFTRSNMRCNKINSVEDFLKAYDGVAASTSEPQNRLQTLFCTHDAESDEEISPKKFSSEVQAVSRSLYNIPRFEDTSSVISSVKTEEQCSTCSAQMKNKHYDGDSLVDYDQYINDMPRKSLMPLGNTPITKTQSTFKAFDDFVDDYLDDNFELDDKFPLKFIGSVLQRGGRFGPTHAPKPLADKYVLDPCDLPAIQREKCAKKTVGFPQRGSKSNYSRPFNNFRRGGGASRGIGRGINIMRDDHEDGFSFGRGLSK